MKQWRLPGFLLQVLLFPILSRTCITPHPSHFSLAESIAAAERIAAEQTWFIHFSHDIGLQAETELTLPKGMHMAYDNLQILW